MNAVARRVWRFFCSVRLALILILVLTGLSVLGALIMQVPPEVKADPADYQWWLNNPARERFGLWAGPLHRLWLFDVFHSPWFLGAGLLLVVNIVVCTLNRWPSVWRSVTQLRVTLPPQLYETGSNRVQLSSPRLSPEQVEAAVQRVLRRHRYRVLRENHPEAIFVAGDKNRHFRLGTYLVHLSIVLFIAAYIIGSTYGFRLNALMVPEGSVREVGQDTGLSLKVLSFVDEYWPEGPPKDYRSEVVLYEAGQEVRRATIRVNHPLRYNGIRFYQAFYGPAVVMEVHDSDDRLVFNDAVALGWVSGKEPFQRPLGLFNLPGSDPGSDTEVYVVGPTSGYADPLLKAGQVRLELYRTGSRTPLAVKTVSQGQPEPLLGYTFTFVREKQFSGFQVSKDPGNLLIWISSGLFVLGMSLVFYFPHRQLWARCWRGERGKTEVVLRTISSRSYAVTSELEGLASELSQALGQGKEA
ncbi:MAG: cytochrome c biogenesis protein ResB [Dehalococcoidia bacterium]